MFGIVNDSVPLFNRIYSLTSQTIYVAQIAQNIKDRRLFLRNRYSFAIIVIAPELVRRIGASWHVTVASLGLFGKTRIN